MPWIQPMQQRELLIQDITRDGLTVAEACRRRGVSRKTGYKWLARFDEEGAEGLADRSRAPLHHAHAMSDQTVDTLLEVKHAHMTWGPGKVIDHLVLKTGRHDWPATSSVAELFSRHGLVTRRRRRVHASPSSQPFADVSGPNDLWCMDFKGWWRCGDGTRCDPLTITDAATRYLLRSNLVERCTYERSRVVIEAAFREFGLPLAVRTDNGPPFASLSHQGLSRLALWWLKLGIRHERITPGKPQQNGRHERMHLTMKNDVVITHTARQQQKEIDRFRNTFNNERPHDALNKKTPASVYKPAIRSYPSREPELHYAPDLRVIKVRPNGSIKWKRKDLHISDVLVGEHIALIELDERFHQVFVGQLAWALVDGKTNTVVSNEKRPTPDEKVLPMCPE